MRSLFFLFVIILGSIRIFALKKAIRNHPSQLKEPMNFIATMGEFILWSIMVFISVIYLLWVVFVA